MISDELTTPETVLPLPANPQVEANAVEPANTTPKSASPAIDNTPASPPHADQKTVEELSDVTSKTIEQNKRLHWAKEATAFTGRRVAAACDRALVLGLALTGIAAVKCLCCWLKIPLPFD